MTITDPNAPGSAAGSSTYNSQVPHGAPNTFTRLQYVKAVLAQGGWRDTPDNEQFLLNLAQREHAVQDTKDPSAAFNLFDSEKPSANSTFFNHTSSGAGVQNYPTFQAGVAAAVATLKQGFYPKIQAALAQGNANTQDGAGAFAGELSTWSGGAYTTVADANGQDAPISSTGFSDQGTGTAGFDGSTGASGAQSTTGDIDGMLKSQAPELAKALSDPAVKGLLAQWGANAITDQEFQNELENTAWWKNTPLSQRQALVEKATDPATLQQTITQDALDIRNQATQMGVTLTQQQALDLATQKNANGWTAAQVTANLAANIKTTSQATSGEAATDLGQLQALYKSYVLDATPQQLNTQLQSVLSGAQTLQGIQSSLAKQAKLLYSNNPQLAANIGDDNTTTTRALLDPLISRAANVLGVDSNTIDPNNPQWGFLLKPQTNADTGVSTGNMWSLDDLQKKIETDPTFGFSTTANGVKQGTDIVAGLQAAFTGRSGI